jgi:hypothetical protein
MSLNRFLVSELTFSRVYQGIKRRVADIPHAVAWQISNDLIRENKERLRGFVGRHTGQRCFILANGPSLGSMDLGPLAGEFSIGLNRIYLLFGRLVFQPTYYVCVNELLLEQFSEEIDGLVIPKFLNWNRRSLFSDNKDSTHFVRLSLGLQDKFVHDFERPLCSGGTVTYVALQIAHMMGFTEVVLIGLDHSFADKGIPNKVETRHTETDTNHFHPNYFPKGSKWQLPDLKRSELAYQLARDAFEKDGRKILDATINGHCPVFEKVNFDSLF